MWLASPAYEVRLINMKSGKDIPGTRLFKGGYFKCRRVFLDKRLKYGQMVRLQAVAVLDHRISDAQPATPHHVVTVEPVEPAEPHDIAASNARQSEFMEKHQDEPNTYGGEDDDDHECDSKGPLDWDFESDDYVPTCSFCGRFIQEPGESDG
jgi:hypothetical protein